MHDTLPAPDRIAQLINSFKTAKIEADAEKARNELILELRPLFVKIARKYQGPGASLEELLSEAVMGLFRALAKAHISPTEAFVPIAWFYADRAILDMLSCKAHPITPLHSHKRINKLRRAVECGEASLEMSDRRLGQLLNLPRGTVKTLRPFVPGPLSLDQASDSQQEDGTVGDCIADKNAVSPRDELIAKDDRTVINDLARAIGNLPRRHANILQMRFGLDGHERLEAKQIAAIEGVSPQRIRFLVDRSIKRLRENLNPTWQSDAA